MKTLMKTKKILAGLVLVSSGMFGTVASADVINSWEWRSDGGFVTSGPDTATCANGSVAPGNCNLMFNNAVGVTPSGLPNTASVMTWGTGTTTEGGNGSQSGLQGVFGASSGPREGPFDAALLGSGPVPIPEFDAIMTNGGWYNTGAAIHYNNVILLSGSNMETATLRTTFELLTPAPLGANLAVLDIVFNETPNVPGCPFGNPLGTECDDIFSLTGAFEPINFTIDGVDYVISFRFFGENDATTFIDGNTIYTAETAPGTSTVFVQARIDTIPLPGALALMGMGLVMIGWQVRGRGRRRKLV